MSKSILAGAALLLIACASVGAQAQTEAVQPGKLTGTWKSEQSGFTGSAETYLTLLEDGQCFQVAKAKFMGTTHWADLRCTWVVEGQALVLTVRSSAAQPELAGKVLRAYVSKVSTDAFAWADKPDSSKAQAWSRVSAIPPEFQAKLPGAGK